MMSGLDVHYDLGEGHPLVGRRMPDVDIRTAGPATRVYELLHDARPVLIHFGSTGNSGVAPWPRVRFVDATYDGAWEVPLLGRVEAPAAALIRPDGYVAWAGELSDPALPNALTRWFGQPLPIERRIAPS